MTLGRTGFCDATCVLHGMGDGRSIAPDIVRELFVEIFVVLEAKLAAPFFCASDGEISTPRYQYMIKLIARPSI